MQTVDLYCERLGPGLLAEPLNALSNLAFLLGAFLVWRSRPAHLPAVHLPAVLLAAVGLGSFVFHTWASEVGMVLDVVPIVVLIGWAGRQALVRQLACWLAWKQQPANRQATKASAKKTCSA